MVFQNYLKRVVEETPGGLAGLLMGFDGIAVESYVSAPDVDILTIGMELSFILTQVRKAADNLQAGALHEMMVQTDNLSILLRALTSEYFLALAIDAKGNTGKGRYLLKIVTPALQEELV